MADCDIILIDIASHATNSTSNALGRLSVGTIAMAHFQFHVLTTDIQSSLVSRSVLYVSAGHIDVCAFSGGWEGEFPLNSAPPHNLRMTKFLEGDFLGSLSFDHQGKMRKKREKKILARRTPTK